jgi:hypothetical protein
MDQSDFIQIARGRYLSSLGYAYIEEWAEDIGYVLDPELGYWTWPDEYGTDEINIEIELRKTIDDATWGWEITSWASENGFKRDFDGLWDKEVHEAFEEAFIENLRSEIEAEMRRQQNG